MTTEYATPGVISKFDEHSTGDKVYENLDRFGRVKAKAWKDNGTIIDKYTYTYDYASNRVTRANTQVGGRDEKYSYDGQHRLTNIEKGTLVGTSITSKNFEQDWAHDALGNWSTFKQNDDGMGVWDTDQPRAHNEANEITEISSASTHVGHDEVGNMTKVPKPSSWSAHYDLKYDAWNRLVEVKDGSTVVATYQYDGIGRRIVSTAGGNTDHYYYDHNWRCLEVRRGSETGTAIEAYVWHPQYIDALAVRYYDSDESGSYSGTNEIQYVLQDANYNVTGLTDTNGVVQERYTYTPYGAVTVLDGSWGTPSSTLANPYTYTGRRFDSETGLYHFRNRDYHAQLGRFLSRDPIGYAGGDANLYGYISGSPLVGTDPFGLDPRLIGRSILQSAANFNQSLGQASSALQTNLPPHTSQGIAMVTSTVQGTVGFGAHAITRRHVVDDVTFAAGWEADSMLTLPSDAQLYVLARIYGVDHEAAAAVAFADPVANELSRIDGPRVQLGRDFAPLGDEAVVALATAGLTKGMSRGFGRSAVRFLDECGQTQSGPVFEGLTDSQISRIRAALAESGLSDTSLLIKGADMPTGYFGMTLGDEGFAINRAIIDDSAELGRTLRHELQHVLDRRKLGDPSAIGQALEEAARAAERGR